MIRPDSGLRSVRRQVDPLSLRDTNHALYSTPNQRHRLEACVGRPTETACKIDFNRIGPVG